jgi:hypothetical protein
VFEVVVMGTVVLLAKTGPYRKARHDFAFSEGSNSIKEYRAKHRRSPKDNPAHSDFGDDKSNFAWAGNDGYETGRRRFQLKKPLTIAVTQAELLRAAGASVGQIHKNTKLSKLKAALTRLTHPIVGGLPSLLRAVQTLPNGQLGLTVNAAWVPGGRYGRVPWPPPKGGAVVLALYLFLFGTVQDGTTAISLEGLYRRVGIKEAKPSHARRALARALAACNAHLKPWLFALDAAGLAEHFTAHFVGEHVRFEAYIADRVREKAREEDMRASEAAATEAAEAACEPTERAATREETVLRQKLVKATDEAAALREEVLALYQALGEERRRAADAERSAGAAQEARRATE